MSHFDKTKGWILANTYTIHHPDKLSDGRPFMSTCVPQSLIFDLENLRIVRGVRWREKEYADPGYEPGFDSTASIHARATTEDSITVFRIPEGKVARFNEVLELTIRPIEKGHVGGKANASSLDGIAYSGMSSSDVPDAGLMEEEPGRLYYWGAEDDGLGCKKKGKALLSMDLFIDREEFYQIQKMITSASAPIRMAQASVTVELFQYEVEASLSEPYFSQDYGLCLTGNDRDMAFTRARLESFDLHYIPTVLGKQNGGGLYSKANDLNQEGTETQMTTSTDALLNRVVDGLNSLNKINKQGQWLLFFFGGVILLFLLLK